jgi:hypothetical protein
MSRDDGWRFLVLGRSLERVDMTARLLSIQTNSTDEITGWRTVLRSCGADEAFLRTHGGTFEPQRVTEFLLLDRLFPRSALHAPTSWWGERQRHRRGRLHARRGRARSMVHDARGRGAERPVFPT